MKRLWIFILFLVLETSMAYGAIPVQSEVDFQVHQQDLYIGFYNPNESTLFFQIRYLYNGTLVTSFNNSNNSGLIKVEMPTGYYRINVTDLDYNNRTVGAENFRIGSILVTGAKSVYVRAFSGDLFPVAMTILFSVGLGAVSLGRFSGLPIMIATLAIESEYEYLPGWPQYLMLFLTVAVASKYIYDFLRE